MITASDASLSQAQWEALRDTYGDVTLQLVLEQYAPEWSIHDTVERAHTGCFAAMMVRISLGYALARAYAVTDHIYAEFLSDETPGDMTWVAVNDWDAPGIDLSVPLTIGQTGTSVESTRIYWYDGSIKYRHGLGTIGFGTTYTLATLANVEYIAATSRTRVHVIYETSYGNHRLAVFNGSTLTDSHIRYPLPIDNMDAIKVNDYDAIVLAADLPPLMGHELAGTSLVWKVDRVSGLLVFRYQDGRWSDHRQFDTVDLYGERTRSDVRLSGSDSLFFNTYLRKEGDYSSQEVVVTSRSGDGLHWDLPAVTSASLEAPAVFMKLGPYIYLVNSTTTMRSDSVAFNNDPQKTEDLTEYVLNLTSSATQLRSTTVTLSNPDDVLRGAGKLLAGGYAQQATLELGYHVDSVARRAQILLADLAAVDRDRKLPTDRLELSLQDRLAILGVIQSPNASEWPSQQIGGDNYIDPTGTGYGGLHHTAVQAGGFETDNEELRLRSNNREGMAWSTIASRVFNGSVQTAFKLHYDDQGEYAGAAFWAQDKDNLWYVAYHPDEDGLYIYERQDGEDVERASVAPMGWTIDTWYYVKVVVNYGQILVYTSTDGVSWTQKIDLERDVIKPFDYLLLMGLPLTCGWAGPIGWGYSPQETWRPPEGSVVLGDEIVLVGTAGEGLYLKNWSTRNDGLSGDALTIYDVCVEWQTMGRGIGALVTWLATADGLYKSTGLAGWSRVTLPEPDTGLGEPDVAALTALKTEAGAIYALVHLPALERAWIYKTVDGGSSWSTVELEATGGTELDIGYTILYDYHKFAEHGGNLYCTGTYRRNADKTWASIGAQFDTPHGIAGGSTYLWQAGEDSAPGITRPEYYDGAWHTAGDSYLSVGDYDVLARADGKVVIIQWTGVDRLYFYNADGSADIPPGHSTHKGYRIQYDTAQDPHSEWTNYHLSTLCEVDGTLLIVGWRLSNAKIWRHTGFFDTDKATFEEEWEQGSGYPPVYRIFVHDGDAYACTGAGQLLKRTGTSWALEGPDLGGSAQIEYGCSYGGHIYVYANDGKVHRRDGDSWAEVCSGFPGPGNVKDLIVYGSTILGIVGEKVQSCGGGSVTVPSAGRAHLLDVDIDDNYVYAGVLVGSQAAVFRVPGSLASASQIYTGGSWAGVMCDWENDDIMWVYGDLGSTKVQVSYNSGGAFTDKTPSDWDTDELIACLLPTGRNGDSIVALLNAAEETWYTSDGGTTWTNRGDVPIAMRSGARELLRPYQIWAGKNSAGGTELVRSSMLGNGWMADQPTTGAGVNVVRTAVIGLARG